MNISFTAASLINYNHPQWDQLMKGFTMSNDKTFYDLVNYSEFLQMGHLKVNNKILGVDISLHDLLSDHVDATIVNKILILEGHSLNPKYKVSVMLAIYNNGQQWPPCDNFDDVCPINLEPIGHWQGYGRGPTSIGQTSSNLPMNMIVIKYNNGHRRAFNKYSYLQALSLYNRDPYTNLQVNDQFLTIIMEKIAQNSIPFLQVDMVS